MMTRTSLALSCFVAVFAVGCRFDYPVGFMEDDAGTKVNPNPPPSQGGAPTDAAPGPADKAQIQPPPATCAPLAKGQRCARNCTDDVLGLRPVCGGTQWLCSAGLTLQSCLGVCAGAAPQVTGYKCTCPAGADAENSSTGGWVCQPVTPVNASPLVLIPFGSAWKYDDRGTDLGQSWRETSFSDKNWASGPGRLGFDTTVETATVINDNGGPPTTLSGFYVRHTFKVDDPSQFDRLVMELIVDDGAVIYLNGREIGRSNLPPGELTVRDRAIENREGLGETAINYRWTSNVVSSSALLRGDNVLAVEVHNVSAVSTDLGVDFQLTALPPGTPAPDPFPVVGNVLFPFGGVWKYRDDNKDLGQFWRESGFDDSGWKSGPARLGFDTTVETATVTNDNGGPPNTTVTQYFRAAFVLDDPSKFNNLNMELIVDDGCVIYLNGKEIGRDNVPPGELSAADTAIMNHSSGTSGETDINYNWDGNVVPASALVRGKNVIAVEVHNNSLNSDDLGFDLQMTGMK